MKHRIKGRKLNRNSSHRKALLRNLSISLINFERIKTTLPKSKELRPYFEKLLTISKEDTLANRRLAYSVLGNNIEAVNKLFTVIGPKIKNRNGGYTRIMKYGFRTGDKAPMSLIEFVDTITSEESLTKKQTESVKIKKTTSETSSTKNKKGSAKKDISELKAEEKAAGAQE